MRLQFKPEQTQSVRDFFHKRDFDFFIRLRLSLTLNGYLLLVLEGEENIEKLIVLFKENHIEFY